VDNFTNNIFANVTMFLSAYFTLSTSYLHGSVDIFDLVLAINTW